MLPKIHDLINGAYFRSMKEVADSSYCWFGQTIIQQMQTTSQQNKRRSPQKSLALRKEQSNDADEEGQCFISSKLQQLCSERSNVRIDQSYEFGAVQNIVRQNLPANQLRTVKRPDKMVARSLFKDMPFWTMWAQLEKTGEEVILNKDSDKQLSNLTSSLKNTNQTEKIPISNPNKRIGPRIYNKERMSFGEFFGQPPFKCIYKKFNSQKKLFTSTTEKLSTDKMHCIQSLVDYNQRAFKQLSEQPKFQLPQIMIEGKRSIVASSSGLMASNFMSLRYAPKSAVRTSQSLLGMSPEQTNVSARGYPCEVRVYNYRIAVDSNFECGNMCNAFVSKERPRDVYLFLENDTNTHGYNNWFFFRVRVILEGNESEKSQLPLRFHIMNITKNTSMYRQGMLVSIFSKNKFQREQVGWFKGGSYTNLASTSFQRSNHPNDFFVSLSFEYTFEFNFKQSKDSDWDQVYFAMNKPYSYTRLVKYLLNYDDKNLFLALNKDAQQQNITQEEKQLDIDDDYPDILVRIKTPNEDFTLETSENYKPSKSIRETQAERQSIQSSQRTDDYYIQLKNMGYTLSNNLMPVMIVGLGSKQQVAKRQVILFIGRQHPSETMGSYVAEGIMNFFKQGETNQFNAQFKEQTNFLLKNYQIVFIPMVNPDGVIHGNSRCNFAGLDLNRRWNQDCMKQLTPQTYRLRNFIFELQKTCGIAFMVDLHGHGKKLNSFIFACKCEDKITHRLFSYMMCKLEPRFQIASCTYGFTRDKEDTIRGQLFRGGVTHSYTLENSFYGYSQQSQIKHYSEKDFFLIGRSVVLSVYSILAQNFPKEKEKCLKTMGWTRESLTNELNTMIDKLEREQKLIGNDRQMLSQSDPQGDILNVEQRLVVIQKTSKALNKRLKQSLASSFCNLSGKQKQKLKTKKKKKGSTMNDTQKNFRESPTINNEERQLRTSCPQMINKQDSEDQIRQQVESIPINPQPKQQPLEDKRKDSRIKALTLNKKWTNKAKWKGRNTTAINASKQQVLQAEKRKSVALKNSQSGISKGRESNLQRNLLINKTVSSHLYEYPPQHPRKKLSRHNKIRTQISTNCLHKEQIPQIPGQYQNFIDFKNSNSYIRNETHYGGRFGESNGVKYKVMRQESLQALLTDSLSILGLDPHRKGSKPTRQTKSRIANQNGRPIQSEDSICPITRTRFKSTGLVSDISKRDWNLSQNHSSKKPQKDKQILANEVSPINRVQALSLNRKYKKFESFITEKSYLAHREPKVSKNSVFYYFPVL